MKHLLSLLLALGLLAGCADADRDDLYDADAEEETSAMPDGEDYVEFGDVVVWSEDLPALTPAALTADPGTYDGTVVRVEGTVSQVCQKKGCWLTLDNPTATPVRVLVPRDSAGNYAFTFPTDLGPREAIVEGTVRVDTASAATLRHFAEDEGRPQTEIDAITEPQPTVVLSARGALVKAPAAVQS